VRRPGFAFGVGVEALEARFLLTAGTSSAPLWILWLDTATVETLAPPQAQVVTAPLSTGANGPGDGTNGTSDGTELSVPAGQVLAADQAPTVTGQLKADDTPSIYQVVLDPTLPHVIVGFSWTGPSPGVGSELVLLNSSGQVLVEEPLTSRAFTINLDDDRLGLTDSVYVEIIPGLPEAQRVAGDAAIAAEPASSTPGFVLSVLAWAPVIPPTTATTPPPPSSPSTGSGTSAGAVFGPVGVGLPYDSASSIPAPTVNTTSTNINTRSVSDLTVFVPLSMARIGPVGGVFANEELVVSAITGGPSSAGVVISTTHDLSNAQAMPTALSRATDLPATNAGAPSSTGLAMVQQLAPTASLFVGPTGRWVLSSDRLLQTAQVIIAQVFAGPAVVNQELAISSQPTADEERAELPTLISLKPILVASAEPAETHVPAENENENDGTVTNGRRTPLRYAMIAGGVYLSSVLIFGLSAPGVSDSLGRLRRWADLRPRQARMPG
jgi:hypothetical protein